MNSPGLAYNRPKIEELMDHPPRRENGESAEAPKGTFVLMVVVAVLLFAGWALLYFGRFLAAGPVK